MSLSEQDYLLIEKSYFGQLSQEEERLFKDKLKQIAFQEEVSMFGTSIELIEQNEKKRLKSILQGEEEKLNSASAITTDKPFVIRHKKYWWAIAATIGLLICSLLFWPSAPNNTDYLVYLKPYENNLIEVERAIPSENLLQQGFYAYNKEEYASALAALKEYAKTETNDNILFYQANCLIGLEQFEEASLIFENILDNNRSLYIQETEWLLALCYLRNNHAEKAQNLLDKINTNLEHPFANLIKSAK